MASKQMFPIFATANIADGAGIKLIEPSDGRVCQGALPNPDHVCFGELGVAVSRPQCHPISLSGVFGVFSRRPNTQMTRLAASGSVARMKNIHACGNGPNKNLIRDTMGAQDTQFAVDGDAELSIAMGSRRCRPVPAPLCGGWSRWGITRHEPAKALLHRQPLGPMAASTGKRIAMTKPASVVSTTKPPAVDRLVANRTGHESHHNRGGHYR